MNYRYYITIGLMLPLYTCPMERRHARHTSAPIAIPDTTTEEQRELKAKRAELMQTLHALEKQLIATTDTDTQAALFSHIVRIQKQIRAIDIELSSSPE